MVIYKIVNRLNGKIYIGQTVQDLSARWAQHRSDARLRSDAMVLHRAMSAHGVENFSISIVSRCSSMEEMNHREKYYIKLFNALAPNGYNTALGGDGHRHSSSSKKKLSEAKKGKKTGFAWNKGIPATKETRAKISFAVSGKKNGMFGKTHSSEAKMSISRAQKGRKRSPEGTERLVALFKKPVLCHQNGIRYGFAAEAAKALGIVSQSVSQVSLGQRKQCKGYTFTYIK